MRCRSNASHVLACRGGAVRFHDSECLFLVPQPIAPRINAVAKFFYQPSRFPRELNKRISHYGR